MGTFKATTFTPPFPLALRKVVQSREPLSNPPANLEIATFMPFQIKGEVVTLPNR